MILSERADAEGEAGGQIAQEGEEGDRDDADQQLDRAQGAGEVFDPRDEEGGQGAAHGKA